MTFLWPLKLSHLLLSTIIVITIFVLQLDGGTASYHRGRLDYQTLGNTSGSLSGGSGGLERKGNFWPLGMILPLIFYR